METEFQSQVEIGPWGEPQYEPTPGFGFDLGVSCGCVASGSRAGDWQE